MTKRTLPAMFLFEISHGIGGKDNHDAPRRTNLDHCIAQLSNVGSLKYELKTFLAKSEWYGIPQSRSRVYILGIRSDQRGPMVAKHILDNTLEHLKQINLPMAEVVLWLNLIIDNLYNNII